jgi:hypothetical protein
MTPDPFAACEERAVVRAVLRGIDGRLHEPRPPALCSSHCARPTIGGGSIGAFRRRGRALGPDRQDPRGTHVMGDPWSIPNVLKALRDTHLKARVTRLGDPPWGRGHIKIDLPFKGRSCFVAIANRDGPSTGRMIWRLVWDGNDSKAGRQRYARAVQSEEYQHICRVLRVGRTYVQFNLFRD